MNLIIDKMPNLIKLQPKSETDPWVQSKSSNEVLSFTGTVNNKIKNEQLF